MQQVPPGGRAPLPVRPLPFRLRFTIYRLKKYEKILFCFFCES
jgi:hypothetical protein